MRWLNLDWDGETVYQFARQARHSEVAHQLLAGGHAYKCFATPQELEEMRAAQRPARQPLRYHGRWRDRAPSQAGPAAPFLIRLPAHPARDSVHAAKVPHPRHLHNTQPTDNVSLPLDRTP